MSPVDPAHEYLLGTPGEPSPLSPEPPTPDFREAQNALRWIEAQLRFPLNTAPELATVRSTLDAAESALRGKPTKVERVWAALKAICDPAGGRGDYLEVCDDQLAAALGAPSSPTPPPSYLPQPCSGCGSTEFNAHWMPCQYAVTGSRKLGSIR